MSASLEDAVANYKTHTKISSLFHDLVLHLNSLHAPFRITGSLLADAASTLKRPDFDLCYTLDLRGDEDLEEHAEIVLSAQQVVVEEEGSKFYTVKIASKKAALALKRKLLQNFPKEHGKLLDPLFVDNVDGTGIFVNASQVRMIVETLSLSIKLPVPNCGHSSAAVTMSLNPNYVNKYKSNFVRPGDEENVQKRKQYMLMICNTEDIHMDVDLVLEFVLSYKCLPQEAKRWESRSKTGWPGHELIETIKKEGGRFVPKTDRWGNLTKDFRLSLALDVLLESLPEYKSVLVILKDLTITFVKANDDDKTVSSFILNNSIAWAREGSKTPLSVPELVNETLIFMVRCYKVKRLPMYFDDQCNILAGINPERLNDARERLEQVQVNLTGRILEMTDKPMSGAESVFVFIKTLYYLSKDDKEEEANEVVGCMMRKLRNVPTKIRQLRRDLSIAESKGGGKDLSSVLLVGYLGQYLPDWVKRWQESRVFESHRVKEEEPETEYEDLKRLIFTRLLPRLCNVTDDEGGDDKDGDKNDDGEEAFKAADVVPGDVAVPTSPISAQRQSWRSWPFDSFVNFMTSGSGDFMTDKAQVSHEVRPIVARRIDPKGPMGEVDVTAEDTITEPQVPQPDDPEEGARPQQPLVEVRRVLVLAEEDERAIAETCPEIRELLEHHEREGNPEIAKVIREALAQYFSGES